jgi:hypothetical protein
MGEIALLGDTSTKCSVVEAILKYYWRVLNVILNKLNPGENGIYNISSKIHPQS